MSSPQLLSRPESGLSTPLVVKVKYEGRLRRFSIYILEDGRPNISLNALRYKICDLFKLHINSDFIITYIDEDNDIIDMVDEDELLDAVKQRLNPLRLEVSFTGQKDVEATMRSSNETSTLKTNPIPKGNNQTLNSGSICLDGILKDLPELLQRTQIKCAEDPFLKYVAPMSKMAVKMDILNKHVATAGSLTEGCQLEPCSDTQANNDTTHTLNGRNDCKFHTDRHICYGPSAPPLSIETNYNHNCHHGLENLSGPTTSSVPGDVSSNGLRRTTRPSKMTFQTFHNGVQCDRCGMSPIVGPRYASKIKDSYDLCLACFYEMGKDDEYMKIVHPFENTPPKFPKEVQCHGSGMSPNVCSSFSSKMKDDYDHCYDSFSQMGNEDQYRGLACIEVGNEDQYRGLGYTEVANCLRIAHPYDSCKQQHIYREGLAHQGKLFDTWSPDGKMDHPSPGTLNSGFVKNITVCDGAQLAPRTHFTKIWRLRNSGTLPWPQHTYLVRSGGVDLGAGNEVNLEIQEKGCLVDEDFDVVVHFIAPAVPGLYDSYWRLMAPSGQMFGKTLRVLIQVVESLKDGVLPLLVKSVIIVKYPEGNAESFQGKSKQRLFGVDISGEECVSPDSMRSVQTTKVTDARAASFRGQSKQKSYGVDISSNFMHPDMVTIPDGTSVIEQSREKTSDVTVQDNSVPVTISDGSSMIEQHREKASDLTVQDSDVPNQLQGVSTDTTFMPSTVSRNSSLYVPVHNASKRNLNVCAGAPCLAMSDTNSYSGKYPEEIRVMEQFHPHRDEIEVMGFNQRRLNADIPRRYNHDIQSTSDVPCTAAEWNSALDELQEIKNWFLYLKCRSDVLCTAAERDPKF